MTTRDSLESRNWRKILAVAVLASGLGLTPQAAESAVPRGACEVSDPSPTPLNVRTEPYGTILRTLRDGTIVYRTGRSQTDDSGRNWSEISLRRSGRGIGWVFREYISCRA